MPPSEESERLLGSTQVVQWSYSEAKAMDESYAFELYKTKSCPVSIARYP